MVQSVYKMKLSPLRRVQRTQDGMIQQFPSRAPLLFTTRDDLIQLCNLWNDSGPHGFRRQSSRLRPRWSLAPFGQVAEIDRNQNLGSAATMSGESPAASPLRSRAQSLSNSRCRSSRDVPALHQQTISLAGASSPSPRGGQPGTPPTPAEVARDGSSSGDTRLWARIG